jgi:hypothetical protein
MTTRASDGTGGHVEIADNRNDFALAGTLAAQVECASASFRRR